MGNDDERMEALLVGNTFLCNESGLHFERNKKWLGRKDSGLPFSALCWHVRYIWEAASL